MNKAQLVDVVQKELGKEISKAAAERALDAVLRSIRRGCQTGGPVQIVGFGTTTLIGNTALTMLASPEELARVRADEELIPSAIAEVLRVSSPVQMDPRCATADTEMCGEKIAKGEIVICWLGAANRDEAVFKEPERFDVGRRENRHLAFGFGTHYCLGSNLARLEAQTALRVLLRRTRDFRLTTEEPLPLHRSIVFRSFTRIPLELDPA